jgi:hypothetical protein
MSYLPEAQNLVEEKSILQFLLGKYERSFDGCDVVVQSPNELMYHFQDHGETGCCRRNEYRQASCGQNNTPLTCNGVHTACEDIYPARLPCGAGLRMCSRGTTVLDIRKARASVLTPYSKPRFAAGVSTHSDTLSYI